MTDYAPAPGPLPGERWIPNNGTASDEFQERWCARCARDREMNGTVPSADATDEDWCPIIVASFRDEAVEWRELENGKTICAAFVGMRAAPGCTEMTPSMPDTKEKP